MLHVPSSSLQAECYTANCTSDESLLYTQRVNNNCAAHPSAACDECPPSKLPTCSLLPAYVFSGGPGNTSTL